MNTVTGRSPPILVRVVCPFCGRLWFRHAAAGSTEETEIVCPGIGCNRLITFRLVNAVPIIEKVVDRKPQGWPRHPH